MFRSNSSASNRLASNRLGCVVAALVAAASWYSPTAVSATDEQLRCLAQNVYHEARGEQEAGQLAVAAVTLNRVRSPSYPNTVCSVVWQPWQFSWTRDDPNFVPAESRAWNKAWRVARLALGGRRPLGVGHATHFHAHSVRPEWSEGYRVTPARYRIYDRRAVGNG
jgi:N-acetylmuramoyl-L-alanine amidase